MIWRVDSRRDFEQLRRGPRRRSGPLTVTVGPHDASKPPRVAYALGRKVGTAPRRNRLRRRLRALVAAYQERLVPATYLIAVRPGAAECSFDELDTHLSGALQALDALSAGHRG